VSKILWVKFGWSDFYCGSPVGGDFQFIKGGEQGHEAWNFLPQHDGWYYCHTPPQGGSGTPWNDDPHGWTVVCLARRPKHTGIHVVGWYEDAELIGHYAVRPPGFDADRSALSDDICYTIRSRSVWFVPPELRTRPFSHCSVGTGKYSFLDGPDVDVTDNKRAVRLILEDRLARLGNVAIHNPNADNPPDQDPDRDDDEIDPLGGFGGPEHRKAVEDAAVKITSEEMTRLGYAVVSREKENVGYDLHATHQKDGSELHVEVKGTASHTPNFFMTANEYGYQQVPEWRLAVVTDALTKPTMVLRNLREVERDFDLRPMVWRANRKVST
jgi:hypothetical protein